MTSTQKIAKDRLAKLKSISLLYGSHRRFEDGVCAMEAVAWLANEPQSDAPKCACTIIAAFVRRINASAVDLIKRMCAAKEEKR